MQGKGQRFGVSRWAAWDQGKDDSSKPDLAFVPAMLRRRLSRLSALAVSVANTCLGDECGVPVVLVSQHGELSRTANLLTAIARREPLSPTAFSLSVHNTASGLLTLIRTERAAATAIAAGPHSLAMGFLEAASQAHERDGAVLLVCADARPPEPYGEALPACPEYAFAVLVAPDGNWQLETADRAAEAGFGKQVPELMALLRGERAEALLGDTTQAWRLRNA